ncbi:MAG: Mrp/NBP35 family ATP-binding protein [Bacilli bacterium]|nr:Mrp/NBP35 family ATP-binding protein [Bacilli bacterium]
MANFSPFRVKAHPLSNVKKVIAVCSGKGGVGKSLTTALLAINARRAGKKVAIIDADVTGPSIPKIFGLSGMIKASEDAMFPAVTESGIEVISLNLMTDDPSAPVIWRGPVISGLIKQFWTDVAYGDIDELYIDMPPGPGDVPLTVFQSLPVDAIVTVTSPQDLVSLIVEKSVRMAQMMEIPLLGVVHNMSYYACPHCGEKLYPFGQAHLGKLSQYGIEVEDELPIDPSLASLCDAGLLERYEGDYLQAIGKAISEFEVKHVVEKEEEPQEQK